MITEGSDRSRVLRGLTTDIVSAYLAHNSMRQAEVVELIRSVHDALNGLGLARPAPAPEKLVPMLPIKKSITPDYLISLEDGRHYKSLKRHLAGRGLTPTQYRTKWGLAADYPMVAENYARRRSELAKSFGLGRKREAPAPVPAAKSRRKTAG